MTRAARYGYRKLGAATPWNDFKKPDGDAKKFFRDREQSRAERRINRKNRTICFNCRQTGHAVAQCPETQTQAAGICYRCGESNHTTKACTKQTNPEEGEFPFATCFLCKEKGHLTRSCPKNDHGLYPNGGCCRFCGKTDHLKKDCPDMRKRKDKADDPDIVGVMDSSKGAESVEGVRPGPAAAGAPKAPAAKKKKKVVTF